MSIDLQGWYIAKKSKSNPLQGDYLEPPDCNLCWEFSSSTIDNITTIHRDGVGPKWYSADEEYSFKEQVDFVVKELRNRQRDENDIVQFIQEAKNFEERSKRKGLKIFSWWL